MRVAAADERLQRFDDLRVMRRFRGPASRGDALEERGLAGNRPDVEHGKEELGVVRLRLAELPQLADVLADGEAQIPERLQEGIDETLFGGADLSIEDDQQVDVGVQAQQSAAVSTDGADGHGRARRRDRRHGELAHERVDAAGVPRQYGPAAAAVPRLRGVLLARGGENRGGAGSQLVRLLVISSAGNRRPSQTALIRHPRRAARRG